MPGGGARPSLVKDESSAARAIDEANRGLKRVLTKVAGSALAVIVGITVVGQIAEAFRDSADSQIASQVNSAGSETEPVMTTQAIYFDQKHVPLFVGKTAGSAAKMLRDYYEEWFDEIRIVESREKLSTYFRRDSDLDELAGYYVCSQSIAPGSDPHERAFGNIKLEVSLSCADRQPDFAMGPAARLLGRYVPPSLGNDCTFFDYCEVEALDGVIIGFKDEDSNGYRTADLQTGLGRVEVKLAMIDLASRWCDIDDQFDAALRVAAIEARDNFLPAGTHVRLLGSGFLGDYERMFHRIADDGSYLDGEPEANSVNELLVASGTWVPSRYTASHPCENTSYFETDMLDATWVVVDAGDLNPQELAYRTLIAEAAQDAIESPAGLFSTCTQSKEESVVALIREEEEEKEEEERRRVALLKSSSDDDGVWTLDDCDGDRYYEHPQLCDGGDRLVREALAGGGSSGSSGGGSGSSFGSSGGSNCTYVDPYTRKDGTRVRGHTRCR